MATFDLTIVTPAGRIYQEEVSSLTAPGKSGYFGIMARHAPMIAEISRGVLAVKRENQSEFFAVVGGVLEVSGEGVVVLADLAQEADSLDHAKEIAETAMREDDEDEERAAD